MVEASGFIQFWLPSPANLCRLPVGTRLVDYKEECPDDGSIMVIVATDALSSHANYSG